MHYHFRNVEEAFRILSESLRDEASLWRREDSRNGRVLRYPEPVMFSYACPWERVLLLPGRDANPFFHVYEVLWMLSGRNDVESLSYYNSRMKDYSDDGKTFNAPYGARWRNWPKTDPLTGQLSVNDIDQLDLIVELLRNDPDSRRAVLSIWSPEEDLLKCFHRDTNCPECGGGGIVGMDIGDVTGVDCAVCNGGIVVVPPTRDVACNTQVYFEIGKRDTTTEANREYRTAVPVLDMTVMNRSNDFLWGMLGANFVQFSFLQEYIARSLGVGIGTYHHFSNNLHVYLDKLEPRKWLDVGKRTMHSLPVSYGGIKTLNYIPLLESKEIFDREVRAFVEVFSRKREAELEDKNRWTEPFLRDVAYPMCMAWGRWKEGNKIEAKKWVKEIAAVDWRIACEGWFQRRIVRKNNGK